MDIKVILDDEFGFTHVDTRHIAKDIELKTFALYNKKIYSPLPSFDLLALDKVMIRQETEVIAIDWVLTKTEHSKRYILVCLLRPRNLSLTSVLSLMDYTSPGSGCSDVKTPQDPISRAVTESLRGQETDFKVLVQEQVVSDQEVFTHFCIQVEHIDDRRSFAIDGKKWVTSLKKIISDLGLIPNVAEVVDIPISQVTSGYRQWHEFMLFLKMSRRQGSTHGIIESTRNARNVIALKGKDGVDKEEQVEHTMKNDIPCDSDSKSKGEPKRDLETISQGSDISSSSIPRDISSSNNGKQQQQHHQQQPHRNPRWRGWVQGIAFGLVFGTLPMWHLISEF
jgi:hypothetical protein